MNNKDILTYLVQSGKIDIATLEQEIEMQRRQQYISEHPNKIWQGSNGYWYTRINGKLIKKVSQEKLYDSIVEFYKKKPTFKDIFNSWIQDKIDHNEIRTGTYERYLSDYQRFIAGSKIESMEINAISEDDIEEFIRYILSTGLQSKAYAGLRTLILGTFKHAKRLKLTEISISTFFKDLDLSRRIFKPCKPRKQTFDEDEVPVLLGWLRSNPSVGNLNIVLGFQTGLRSGELAALKFSDICGNKLHVQRQEIRYRDYDHHKYIYKVEEYTKTEAGDRFVSIPQAAVETINLIKSINPNEEYLMVENGKKLHKNLFNVRLRKACKECGLDERSMHKVRKTYASRLIDKGVDKSLVMTQMGHSDISTTLKYYYFPSNNDQRNLEQIENAITW